MLVELLSFSGPFRPAKVDKSTNVPADTDPVVRWFYVGVACVLVAGALYAESVRRTGREPGGPIPAPSLALRLPGQGAPVLVFQLGHVESVAVVREAVAKERVVAEMPAGFALAEGRIVAAGPDVTAVLLRLAGWSDRPLEIYQPAPVLPDLGGRRRGSRTDGPDLGALARKSHLTRQEAMAVMERLD